MFGLVNSIILVAWIIKYTKLTGTNRCNILPVISDYYVVDEEGSQR